MYNIQFTLWKKSLAVNTTDNKALYTEEQISDQVLHCTLFPRNRARYATLELFPSSFITCSTATAKVAMVMGFEAWKITRRSGSLSRFPSVNSAVFTKGLLKRIPKQTYLFSYCTSCWLFNLSTQSVLICRPFIIGTAWGQWCYCRARECKESKLLGMGGYRSIRVHLITVNIKDPHTQLLDPYMHRSIRLIKMIRVG